MSDLIYYGAGALIATGVLFLIAFPDVALPLDPKKQPKKVFRAPDWGVYKGHSTEVEEDAPGLTVETPARKAKAVIGSTSYALGRSISFRK